MGLSCPLLIPLVAVDSCNADQWAATVVKSVLHGTGSTRPVSLLADKWVTLPPVILTPCHSVSITFQVASQTVKRLNKKLQNVPDLANLDTRLPTKKIST